MQAKQSGTNCPNILFIYLDDLGYGDVSCLNPDSRIETPNIDRIAREGLSFSDAHTPAAICGPSRYGLMTGRYPWRRGEGGTGNGAKFRDLFMEKDRTTIASLLRKHGYNTGQFGKWGIRHDYSQAVKPGKEPGHIDAYDFPRKRLLGPQLVGFEYAWTLIHLTGKGETKHAFENGVPVDPEWQTRPSDPYRWLPDSAMKVIEYIEAYGGAHENPAFGLNRERPFFIYWDPPSPHLPIVPNEPFHGASQAGPYGDFVVEIDHYVGKMLDTLERLELADNTMVIFSSDNGPEGVCYPRIQEYGHYSMGPWRGIKRDTWEGGHRLPLFVRWPEGIPAGGRCEELVCLTDWLATFAGLLGDRLPDGAGEDSISILPYLRGDPVAAPPLRDSVVHHTPNGHFAIRKDHWVFIDHETGDANQEPDWFRRERGVHEHDFPGELFNLEEDPQQTTNLYESHPGRVDKLKALLATIMNTDGV